MSCTIGQDIIIIVSRVLREILKGELRVSDNNNLDMDKAVWNYVK